MLDESPLAFSTRGMVLGERSAAWAGGPRAVSNTIFRSGANVTFNATVHRSFELGLKRNEMVELEVVRERVTRAIIPHLLQDIVLPTRSFPTRRDLHSLLPRMDPEKEPPLAETSPRNLVNGEIQSSNLNLGTGTNSSKSPSPGSLTLSLPDLGDHFQRNPPTTQYRNQDSDDDYHLSHRHSAPLPTTDTSTRPTFVGGLSPLSEVHASALDHTGLTPTWSTTPSQRNPYQYLTSHPDLTPPNPQRSSSQDRLKKPGEKDPPFSPPFLHPASLRVRSRSHSPLPPQRSNGLQKLKTKFTLNPSPPNSPVEPEQEHDYPAPKPVPRPFSVHGFLSLSVFEKVVVIVFACCGFLLFRALFGIGHSAEGCGLFAHGLAETGSGPGDAISPRSDAKDGAHLDRTGGEGRVRVWLDKAKEMYEYQHDWKLGEYEIEHDDEYEHEDSLDRA